MTIQLPYRELTLKEVIARICAGQPVTWLTLTDHDGTYDVAVVYGAERTASR